MVNVQCRWSKYGLNSVRSQKSSEHLTRVVITDYSAHNKTKQNNKRKFHVVQSCSETLYINFRIWFNHDIDTQTLSVYLISDKVETHSLQPAESNRALNLTSYILLLYIHYTNNKYVFSKSEVV